MCQMNITFGLFGESCPNKDYATLILCEINGKTGEWLMVSDDNPFVRV